jgi:hypothetical protein
MVFPQVYSHGLSFSGADMSTRRYVCAPNFWEDLRSTLQAIEQRRDERGKLKAQQVPGLP